MNFNKKIINLETEESFFSLIEKKDTFIIVSFSATWCSPCNEMSNILNNIINNKNILKNFFIIKVNVDKFKNLAQKYNIRSIPTMFFIKNNKTLNTHSGVMDEDSLLDFINSN